MYKYTNREHIRHLALSTKIYFYKFSLSIFYLRYFFTYLVLVIYTCMVCTQHTLCVCNTYLYTVQTCHKHVMYLRSTHKTPVTVIVIHKISYFLHVRYTHQPSCTYTYANYLSGATKSKGPTSAKKFSSRAAFISSASSGYFRTNNLPLISP